MHRVIRVSKTAPLFSVLWYLKGCIDLRRVLLKGVSEVRAERALDVGHRVGGRQGPTTCRREGRENDTEAVVSVCLLEGAASALSFHPCPGAEAGAAGPPWGLSVAGLWGSVVQSQQGRKGTVVLFLL